MLTIRNCKFRLEIRKCRMLVSLDFQKFNFFASTFCKTVSSKQITVSWDIWILVLQFTSNSGLEMSSLKGFVRLWLILMTGSLKRVFSIAPLQNVSRYHLPTYLQGYKSSFDGCWTLLVFGSKLQVVCEPLFSDSFRPSNCCR